MIEDIIIIIVDFFRWLFRKDKGKETTEKVYQRKYSKKRIMTECEYEFYKKIRPLENSQNIRIIPQLNLATIIQKTSNDRYQNELYRNIDFAIFNNDLTEILLLIELNDKTHNTKKRKDRDAKVKSLTSEAGIELMTFYTSYDNKIEYVQDRIIKSLFKNDGNEEAKVEGQTSSI